MKFLGKASGSLYCLQVEHTHLTSERGPLFLMGTEGMVSQCWVGEES